MKQLILFFLLINFTLGLANESVVMKFYTKNGVEQQFINASQLNKLSFNNKSDFFSLFVYHSANQKSEFLVKNIDSIIFNKNQENNHQMSVYIGAASNNFVVSNIDSLIFENLFEVAIGNQVWMRKNLDVTTYRNGDPIRHAVTVNDWLDAASKKEGAWCYLDNNSNNNAGLGKLYNWYAVNDPRGLAPTGWKIPSNSEWTTLVNYLGGVSVAGGKLKETGHTYWTANNLASNSSGFTARPGGMRGWNGIFYQHGTWGKFWTATSRDTDASFGWQMVYHSLNIESYGELKSTGFSVRCIKE